MRIQRFPAFTRSAVWLVGSYMVVAAIYFIVTGWILQRLVPDPVWRYNAQMGSCIVFILGTGIVMGLLAKHLQSAALREQHITHLLSANKTELVVTYTPDQQLAYISPSCQALTGYSQEEFANAAWARLLAPADLLVMQTRIKAAFARGCGSYGEAQLVMQNGDTRWMQVVVEALRDEDCVLIGVQVRMHDITDRKLLQERLAQTEARLVKNEKLALLGQLVSGIMHELNNPLAAVLGYTQLLLQANIPAHMHADLAMIETQARRSSKIVTNLLGFARQREPIRTATDINNVVERTIELRAYHLQTHNVTVDLWLAPDMPVTSADPYQLQQVLLNIVINAEQALIDAEAAAIDAEPMRLVIETSYEQRSEASESYITIRVSDTGPGIEPEVLDHIFEPFFTTKPEGYGTGLGLVIARDIVDEHGGVMAIESKVGQGTAVTITLPVLAATPITSVVRDKSIIPAATRVLVADDEEAIRELIARALGQWGAQVDRVSDGVAALKQIKETRYDLVICDLHMPGMGGQNVYETLATSMPNLSRSLLFITGDSINTDAASFMAETGCQYLTKPFDIETLLRTVVSLLPPTTRHAGQQYALPFQGYGGSRGHFTRAA